MVSIQGSCLKLLQVVYAFCLPSLSLPILVRLFSRGGLGLYLYLYLFHYACIFNSLKIYAKIMACIGLHIQFPEDMCTSFVFFFSSQYGICAYIFSSWRICAQVLYSFLLAGIGSVHVFQFPDDMCTSGLSVLTYKEVLSERSTRENDLLRNVLMTY